MELLIATTILSLVMGLALVAYVGVLKRSFHTEALLEGSGELRAACDTISQAVRSAAVKPEVKPDAANSTIAGTRLFVAPSAIGSATVQDTGNWVDMVNNVHGSKSTMSMVKLSNVIMAPAIVTVFSSAARPSGALAAGDVPTYFKDATALRTIDLRTLFTEGDTITIPATAYGAKKTVTINSISNNPGNKTLNMVGALGVDVPNDTRIASSSGLRALFEVRSDGDLRYYPDSADGNHYAVLAKFIDQQPRANPSDAASVRTVPFSLSASGLSLTINLQKLPEGTTAGRTVQGVQTTVFTRTDPELQ